MKLFSFHSFVYLFEVNYSFKVDIMNKINIILHFKIHLII